MADITSDLAGFAERLVTQQEYIPEHGIANGLSDTLDEAAQLVIDAYVEAFRHGVNLDAAIERRLTELFNPPKKFRPWDGGKW